MKRNGFTLIELMIVVAIIGIFAVLISSFFVRMQPQQNSITVESVQAGPKCQGGMVVRQDGTIVVQDGATVKC